MCWANITSASLCASADADVPGATVELDDGECPAGWSDSLGLLQPVEIAKTAKAPAPIRVVRFHIVIVPFQILFIP
jgi:hypothetical protein